MLFQKSSPVPAGRLISASSPESSDILYGSGFNGPDEFIYAELPDGRHAVIVSTLEYQRAKNEVHPGVEVISRGDILLSVPKLLRKNNFLVHLSKYFKVGQWIVPERFPLCHADALREAGIAVQAAKDDFFPCRVVKNEEELKHIRQSEKTTEEAMYQVRDFLKESKITSSGVLEWKGRTLTCDFIRSEVEAEFKRKGYTAERTIIACGPDASAPHCIGAGPVRAHQTLVADIFPRSDINGYWGDMTRTFVKGSASPVVRKAFDAVKKASEEVMKILKPGIPGEQPHQLAAKILEDAGFRTGLDQNGLPCGFFHGLGHGVGLDIHENPRMAPGNPKPLEAGNVVSVEPGLYDPSWGGIRLEDLVAITPDGYENFCSMPKELEIS